jgi:hypothetical protein
LSQLDAAEGLAGAAQQPGGIATKGRRFAMMFFK